MNRLIALLSILTVLLTGCAFPGIGKYSKYTYEFYHSFNTMIQFTGYAKSEKQFDELAKKGQARFEDLHRLYDIYNNYEGVNNVKTINDKAGIQPVEVRQELIDILLLAKQWHGKTNGIFNIALGPVLSIWHTCREEGIGDPDNAKLPDMELLKKASVKTDISKLEIDPDKKTAFLREKGMSIDLGAIGKGYATELVAKELAASGANSMILNSGGNIRIVGKPMDGVRKRWGIGIQNPDLNVSIVDTAPPLDVLFLNDSSLVSSGGYERYYEVNGVRYHHLIDPVTLMPANYYKAVTIWTVDSGIADILSTVVFLLPYEKSRALVESLEGVNALWVMPDGSIQVTDEMKKNLRDLGGASGK